MDILGPDRGKITIYGSDFQQVNLTPNGGVSPTVDSLMWRSHQPRFHPDLNRGLYRERNGVVLSAPIRSYHVLMSIGLIVEKILAAKIFSRLTRLPRLSGPSHRIV